MSNPEARLALAKLIADRIVELGIEREYFMKAVGFTKESTFTCYLRGYSNLSLWQVPYVARTLQVDERRVLMMCLAQIHDNRVMGLFLRHMKSRKRGELA
ncbi:hypothetical protein N2600_02460 [Rhizobium sp. WSM1274]|uniref:hypothetical protein n=1 Tax=Rhizobium sp. WSM1274 TaxID=3138254 RepID=UPI0021A69043|nr:hypothetical protein [Rhizobium leguminosarum]UWU28854.1 hypothetical protein N2600_02460 [Rhizobium leguminosarum bv. viciae]